MITVGVDLSASDPGTAVARIEWSDGKAFVSDLILRGADEMILKLAARTDKVGIDCPFGWPDLFVDFVNEHQRGSVAPREGLPLDWRRRLAYRNTDLIIGEVLKRPALSVSADRIAHTAFRCAALLSGLSAAGLPVDRSGQTGRVVEVYPAASLHQWDMVSRGYKRSENLATLELLVTDLLGRTAGWLELGPFEAVCRRSDHAFDAVIAALSARAASIGLVTWPEAGDQAASAQREGWIALPDEGSLDQLVETPAR